MLTPQHTELLCFASLTRMQVYAVKLTGVDFVTLLVSTDNWRLIREPEFAANVRMHFLRQRRITDLVISEEVLYYLKHAWTRELREALAVVLQDTNALGLGDLTEPQNLQALNELLFDATEGPMFQF